MESSIAAKFADIQGAPAVSNAVQKSSEALKSSPACRVVQFVDWLAYLEAPNFESMLCDLLLWPFVDLIACITPKASIMLGPGCFLRSSIVRDGCPASPCGSSPGC